MYMAWDKNQEQKYLYGTFYIPPNSNLQAWDELDQSIDLALNNTHDIIITGDFNINQLSDNHRNKIILFHRPNTAFNS